MRWLFALILFFPPPAPAGTAGDVARAIRENSFDRDECYRVRDLTLGIEDIRLFLTDGHLIFSKPVAGRRIAAVFVADTDGGDAEIMLLPPTRAERRSLAGYIDSPNLDEHFEAAVLLFTGDVYERLKAELASNPGNRKSPEMAPLLDERWTPVLRNLGGSYQTRLTLDLLGGAARPAGLFAAALRSSKLGNFDVVYDPERPEQIIAGRTTPRGGRVYFDTWTSFDARSFRNQAPPKPYATVSDYRIEAAVDAGLALTVVTRVKVRPAVDGLAAVPFEIARQMQVTEAFVDGRPAEVLQRDELRGDIMRGDNALVLVAPPEPLRMGREYEFEFHHSGKVILDAGGGVLYVGARANWYPIHGNQFATYDLSFRRPRNLDLVAPGDVVEDREEGAERITRRRTTAPIRMAGFNLGNYEHARVARGGYQVDICANRTLESALQPKPAMPLADPAISPGSRTHGLPELLTDLARSVAVSAPSPTGRLQDLASEVTSALEFMASKFGPPALPHLAVSPIPGAFGQGFAGLIYLSTWSYLNTLPRGRGAGEQETFFQSVLQAHEVAHQWWGNRVAVGGYRDTWLMEALANYSAMLYLEKSKGRRALEDLLDSYRRALLEKSGSGATVESAGPVILGGRLENSLEPRAWHDIVYGKGSWIVQMLRARMGDARFFAMLGELVRRYDRKEVTTEQFRELAAEFLPPKSDDPKLEAFFEEWVYGTGMPSLALSYSIKGKAPAVKVTGTVTQSEVEGEFSALVPVEIQVARGRSLTQWVRTGISPATFTVTLKQAPLKVTLDPHYAVLRK